MTSDERINLLAKVARTPHGTYADTTGERSILTIAAASYGSKPTDESTVPTGFDPLAAALFESIVEGAYLVATADGVFDDEERKTFERIVTASCGGTVPQRLIVDLVADLSDQLEEDGLELRIERLAKGVSKKEQALEVLRIAALIASVSDDVSAVERDVLERIATAFELDSKTAVDSALDDVEKSLAI
jgi:tellurite resistance protein